MIVTELKFLLKKYSLSPNKIRGQNFLIDESVLDKIIDTADIQPTDLILEVGPGLGALTQRLLPRVLAVVGLEIDKNFQALLSKLASLNSNLEIIWQDILSLRPESWQAVLKKYKKSEYKIVANIPYYLTGKFIQKFMLFPALPVSLTLLLQKEVAERMVAKDKKYSLLSLAVALYAEVKIVDIVKKNSFYPAPQVDSAIVHIYNIHPWSASVSEKKVWQLIHRGFAQKRKKLVNNILTDPRLQKERLEQAFVDLDLDKNVRAERLSPQQWLQLAEKI